MDFGCGTGLIGLEIKKRNIICILHGIDTSVKMIEKALDKDCYHRIFNSNISEEKLNTKFQYDYIISSGVFLEGHCRFNVINDLVPYLKYQGNLILYLENR